MIHLANILILADEPALAQELCERTHRNGYGIRLVDNLDAARIAVGEERPDAILITETLVGRPQPGLAAALKTACGEVPVCLVVDPASTETKVRAFAAGIDDILTPPLDDFKLLAHLRPLVRLAVMRGELRQRAATARRFGVGVDEQPRVTESESDYPVLLVGRGGQAVKSLLTGARITLASDPFVAGSLLEGANYDAAILLPEDDAAPYFDLCAQTRNNPKLFNLPVLVVGDRSHINEEEAYRQGASGFFPTHVDPHELKAAVQALVRRQRARWTVRSALALTLQAATRSESTGVYTRAFLDAYLADRTAANCPASFSLIFFRLPDIEGISQHFGEKQAAHLRRQVAQWISGLLRAEDLTAHYSENEFCVVLPETPQVEAEVVMHRIAGVLAFTDFAVKDVYQPVKIWARVGAAERDRDEDSQSLISRAQRSLV